MRCVVGILSINTMAGFFCLYSESMRNSLYNQSNVSAFSTDLLLFFFCAFRLCDNEEYMTNNLGYGMKTEDGP